MMQILEVAMLRVRLYPMHKNPGIWLPTKGCPQWSWSESPKKIVLRGTDFVKTEKMNSFAWDIWFQLNVINQTRKLPGLSPVGYLPFTLEGCILWKTVNMHSFVLRKHFTVSYLALFFEPDKPNSEADKLIQDNNLMPIFKSEDDGKTDSDSSKWLFSPTWQSGH